ncbi:MAG: hypothetical protein ACPHAN_11820 [Pseudomonadales bacterium]
MDEQEQLAALEQDREGLRLAYRELFKTDNGVRILEDLKARCHYHVPSFDSDPYRTAYNEGQRTIILFIEQMMRDLPQQTEGE